MADKADIQKQIAALQAQLDAEVEKERKNGFPKTIEISVHRSPMSNYACAEEFGLKGDAVENFSRVAYELILTCTLEENGHCVATHIEGVALEEPLVLTWWTK